MFRALYLIALYGILVSQIFTTSYGQSCPVKSKTGDYSYDPTSGIGPSAWGSIEGYEDCDAGRSQSPINFPDTVSTASISMAAEPSLTSTKLKFSSKIDNWALECPTAGSCGSTTYKGVNYSVDNLHFHSPSEHTIDGRRYPLEAHLVHASANGDLLVIATFFNYPLRRRRYRSFSLRDGQNELIQQVLDGVTSDDDSFIVELENLINLSKSSCSYSGSLTTPPCSEPVTFILQVKIQRVSRLQVHAYRLSTGFSIYGNNRPLQPLNGRSVTCYVKPRCLSTRKLPFSRVPC